MISSKYTMAPIFGAETIKNQCIREKLLMLTVPNDSLDVLTTGQNWTFSWIFKCPVLSVACKMLQLVNLTL